MRKKVLVIDDDSEMQKLIKAVLTPLELAVHQAYSGEDGLRQIYTIHPDLVILDVNMPGMDGFEVCSRMREFSNFPIMMLTARIQEKDLLHGFNVGVDDFLRKPFSKNELEARVRALLRRSTNNRNDSEISYITVYMDPVLEINLSSKVVKLLGNIVELSPKEYDLLAFLVRERGKIVSHRELVREAWGELYINDPASISLYIHYLRKKLKDGKHGHEYIRTLWGRGYWFAPRNSDETSQESR
jgi:two-component system KDP operon response regulator KdpE